MKTTIYIYMYMAIVAIENIVAISGATTGPYYYTLSVNGVQELDQADKRSKKKNGADIGQYTMYKTGRWKRWRTTSYKNRPFAQIITVDYNLFSAWTIFIYVTICACYESPWKQKQHTHYFQILIPKRPTTAHNND